MTIEDDRKHKITILAPYDAMVEFIEGWSEQGGRSSDDIEQMLGALIRCDDEGGYSRDGAVWNAYMDIAYRKLEEEGGSDPLRNINPLGSRGNL